MGIVSSLAVKAPTSIQKFIYKIIPFQYRYNHKFRELRKFLEHSQWWSTKKLKQYQWRQLKKILWHAYHHVPYYKQIFQKLEITPDDIKSPHDFKKFPILTKDIIRENQSDLISSKYDIKNLAKFSTSGSTGKRLVFYGHKDLYAIEAAFVDRAFSTHGPNLYGNKSIWLRRYTPEKGGSLWKEDLELSRMYFSAYHLSLKTLPEYIINMNSYRAKLLVGYPSSIYILALLLENSDLKLEHITSIHVASEQMLEEWRKKIEEVFQIPVYDHYGMMEKVSFFHRCPITSNYHENLEYGFTEIINENDGVGEIVGTSLWNYAMPLIRYKISDQARLNPGNKECKCSRGLPLSVAEFAGRSDDILITPDGRYLPGVNFYTMMYKIPCVKMFKIIQHAIGRVEIKIVVDDKYNKKCDKMIIKGMQNRMGKNVEYIIKKAKTITRSRRTGKIRCIENRIIHT